MPWAAAAAGPRDLGGGRVRPAMPPFSPFLSSTHLVNPLLVKQGAAGAVHAGHDVAFVVPEVVARVAGAEGGVDVHVLLVDGTAAGVQDRHRQGAVKPDGLQFLAAGAVILPCLAGRGQVHQFAG